MLRQGIYNMYRPSWKRLNSLKVAMRHHLNTYSLDGARLPKLRQQLKRLLQSLSSCLLWQQQSNSSATNKKILLNSDCKKVKPVKLSESD